MSEPKEGEKIKSCSCHCCTRTEEERKEKMVRTLKTHTNERNGRQRRKMGKEERDRTVPIVEKANVDLGRGNKDKGVSCT